MNIRTTKKLHALAMLATLWGMAAVAHAAPASSRVDKTSWLMAQAAPPAPAASAPAADAQPDNRETPARPAARRRGVGVVISMSVA